MRVLLAVIFKNFYQLKQEWNEKVQIFSIQLRDALTRLSLRFPDRVPKDDHDKILKDHFFYGIHSDLWNSILHLYDEDTVTFTQLLVKAHQNEEEEISSKLVNKGSVMGNTLKERVDKLIAKSNQRPQQYQKGNPTGHNYGRNSYSHIQRSERFQGLNY